METHDILITGGAEFIETNLATELRDRGHHVLAADLRPERSTSELMSEATGRSRSCLTTGSLTTCTTWQPSTAAGTAKIRLL